MEVLNFLKEFWWFLSALGGIVVALWRLTIREVKSSQVAQTQILTAQINQKFAELKGNVNSEISVIKTRLDTLCAHVDRQNGRLDKCENWQLEHTEHYHSRRGD